MLRAYVSSTFDWIRLYPFHARVWLLYLYHCSYVERDNDLNTQFVEIGRKRIEALLLLGIKQGLFNEVDVDPASKNIQTIITGALLTSVSERVPFSLAHYQKEIEQICLIIAGLRNTTK